MKCPNCGSRRTWLGPDVNNSANRTTLIYFSNYLKNPLLNQSNKYFVQAEEGNYDLNILNFHKEDTGVYLCRFLNNGTFNENKYNVLLLGMYYIQSFINLTMLHFNNSSIRNFTGYKTFRYHCFIACKVINVNLVTAYLLIEMIRLWTTEHFKKNI